MKILGELKKSVGSTRATKRLGRGNGSGQGGSSGKGNKGQKARSGGRVLRGFEGGQTPMARRLPKFGFTNEKFRTHYTIISLDQINKLPGEVSPETLNAAGMTTKRAQIKILAKGKVTKPLNVKVHKISAQAKAAIEGAGGKVEVI